MRLIVTREEYFARAMEILGEQGPGGLKIGALCRALKVTTGSFYGYFGSFDGFVEEFLQFWEEEQTERVANLIQLPPDAAERIHLARRLAGELPHAAESAIRSWASTNPKVAAMQRLVDERRAEALEGILYPAAQDGEDARRLAGMAMTLLVGFQQWRKPATPRDFDEVFDEFEEFVLLKLASRGVEVDAELASLRADRDKRAS